MANQWNLPENTDLAKQVLTSKNEIDQKKMDLGLLGLLWGNSRSVPNNIAALTIFMLIISGVIYTIVAVQAEGDLNLSIKDLWSIITPLITLAFGFLFGDGMKKDAT